MQKNDLYLCGAILLILGGMEIAALVLSGATSSAVAAWVEALAVIGALIASLLIPWLARAQDGRQVKLRLRHLAQIGSNTITSIIDASGGVNALVSSTRQAKIWEDLAARVERIPLESVDDDLVHEALISLPIIFRDAAFLQRVDPDLNTSHAGQLDELKTQLDVMIRDNLR